MAAACSVVGLACAGPEAGTGGAREADQDLHLPEAGLELGETLARLGAPPRSRARVWASKRVVLRLDGGGARPLEDEEIEARRAGSRDDLAVVVTWSCLSEVGLRRHRGEKTSWLLLEGGRLSAWDLHTFGESCVYRNAFRPAGPESAALEALVRRYRDDHFPSSRPHPAELYGKGLVYFRAGRFQAAADMLARGDASFDATDPRGVRSERPSDAAELVRPEDTSRLRERLAEALAVPGAPEDRGP